MSGGRSYFYRMDARGRLYHEESELKDPAFLDFFISRIRKNQTGVSLEYPYVSVCAGEWNFIRPETSVYVFQKKENGNLYYSPGLFVPFRPDALRLRHSTLIHPAPWEEWGTFSSELLWEISKRIVFQNSDFFYESELETFRI
ncbi:DUF4505 domain-containing protein, partial [Leptospira gomenensis]